MNHCLRLLLASVAIAINIAWNGNSVIGCCLGFCFGYWWMECFTCAIAWVKGGA